MTRILKNRLLVSALFLVPLRAQAETLTLDTCVATALAENPEVTSANLEIEAASAKKSGAFGAYGPRLRLEGGYQHWDSKIEGAFLAGLGEACTNCTWATDPATQKPMIYSPLEMRAQDTWSVGATLAQPLLSLWTVREANVLAHLGVDVARLQRQQTRRNLTFQVIEAYYRLLQAKRMGDVAEKSVEQIEAQVKRAESFFERGMVARNDVLRAHLGLAAAKQRLIQMKGSVILARGRLATLLGRSPDSPIDVVDGQEIPSALYPPTAEQAESRAVASRLEIKEVAMRVHQADAGVRLSKSKMLPQLNAVANYTRGSKSLIQSDQAWFVGAQASWDLWEGGSTYYGIAEAKARLAQALSARKKVEDMIRLDTRSAHVNLTTAAEGMEVAQQAVTQAEENFRIEQKRYESASNTSFDVLDAETQLTTARAQHQAAIYDHRIATANLTRAMGEKLSALKDAP